MIDEPHYTNILSFLAECAPSEKDHLSVRMVYKEIQKRVLADCELLADLKEHV